MGGFHGGSGSSKGFHGGSTHSGSHGGGSGASDLAGLGVDLLLGAAEIAMDVAEEKGVRTGRVSGKTLRIILGAIFIAIGFVLFLFIEPAKVHASHPSLTASELWEDFQDGKITYEEYTKKLPTLTSVSASEGRDYTYEYKGVTYRGHADNTVTAPDYVLILLISPGTVVSIYHVVFSNYTAAMFVLWGLQLIFLGISRKKKKVVLPQKNMVLK